MRRILLLLLLVSIATAGGSVEPPPTGTPAWRTGPLDFTKARRVRANYCYVHDSASP